MALYGSAAGHEDRNRDEGLFPLFHIHTWPGEKNQAKRIKLLVENVFDYWKLGLNI
jgi:hypothetical protein